MSDSDDDDFNPNTYCSNTLKKQGLVQQAQLVKYYWAGAEARDRARIDAVGHIVLASSPPPLVAAHRRAPVRAHAVLHAADRSAPTSSDDVGGGFRASSLATRAWPGVGQA